MFIDFTYEANNFYSERYERNPGRFWVNVVLGIAGLLMMGSLLWSIYCFKEFECKGNSFYSAISLGIGGILVGLSNSSWFEEGCNI